MYRCQQCGKQSQSGEKLNKKIVSTRQKSYINIRKDERKRKIEKITEGNEIMLELSVCGDCDE